MEPPPANSDPQRPDAALLNWAYRRGIFPMAEGRRIDWYSPDPRAILPLDSFHVPRSLARVVRQGRFEIRTDTAFERVMRCSAEGRPEGTWIDDRLVRAYVELHRAGGAHSVEAWRGDELVGGLYGVHLGGAFFGESMFSRSDAGGRDASKVCLVHLVRRLIERGFSLLDTQFVNPHMAQFGCIEIRRGLYLRRLGAALRTSCAWE